MLRGGMDAYVTKPIEPKELSPSSSKSSPARADRSVPAPSADDPEVLDADALLRRVNGNQAAVAEIIAIFRADSARCSARSTRRYRPGRGGARARRAPAEGGADGRWRRPRPPARPFGSRTSRGTRPPPGCRCAGRVGSRAGTASSRSWTPSHLASRGKAGAAESPGCGPALTATDPPRAPSHQRFWAIHLKARGRGSVSGRRTSSKTTIRFGRAALEAAAEVQGATLLAGSLSRAHTSACT